MGMNVGSASGDEDQVNSTINTTPLVDVMLVMLIIFLITIPVVTTSIKVQLPKEEIQIRESKPEPLIARVVLYSDRVPIAIFSMPSLVLRECRCRR